VLYDAGSAIDLNQLNDQDDACVYRALVAAVIDLLLCTGKVQAPAMVDKSRLSDDEFIAFLDKAAGTDLA
jgi:hypothetical protein